MKKTVLEARGLGKVFSAPGGGSVTALENVSFELFEGEILGILGESGSGKSTLARLLTGLLERTSGEVRLGGRPFAGLGDRATAREIQMVFQDPAGSFDPRRTLGDGIGESLLNAGVPRRRRLERTAMLLAECGLTPDFAGRYPHEVSGGECQRAAIARALAIRPRVLVCDEATSALDVTVQAQIVGLLGTLRREEGVSILFITHQLALAQRLCDRMIVMERGRIVEEGVPGEMIAHPRSEAFRAILEASL